MSTTRGVAVVFALLLASPALATKGKSDPKTSIPGGFLLKSDGPLGEPREVVWTTEVREIVGRFFSKAQAEVPESIAREMRQRVEMAIRAGGVANLEPAAEHRGPRLEIHGIGPDSGLEHVGEKPVTTMYVIRGKGALSSLEGGYLRGRTIDGDWYGRTHVITAEIVGRGFAHKIEVSLPEAGGLAGLSWNAWATSTLELDAEGRVIAPVRQRAPFVTTGMELNKIVDSMDPLMKQRAQHITLETAKGEVVLAKVKPTGRPTGHPKHEADRRYGRFRKGPGRKPHSSAYPSNRALPTWMREKKGSRKGRDYVHR